VSQRRLLVALVVLTLAACELIVDFDSDPGGADTKPTAIPQLDGAVAVVVDASAIADSTLVRAPPDATRPRSDGGDAGDAGDGGPRSDGGLDGGLDGALPGDGGADASELDAGPDAQTPDAAGDADELAPDSADADAGDGASEDGSTDASDAASPQAAPTDAAGPVGAGAALLRSARVR
jgi:hypothetical protein